MIACVSFVLLDEFLFKGAAAVPGFTVAMSRGVLPVLVFVAVLWGANRYLTKLAEATLAERVMMLFVTAFVGYLTLTVIGVWFRGEGMALVLPW